MYPSRIPNPKSSTKIPKKMNLWKVSCSKEAAIMATPSMDTIRPEKNLNIVLVVEAGGIEPPSKDDFKNILQA